MPYKTLEDRKKYYEKNKDKINENKRMKYHSIYKNDPDWMNRHRANNISNYYKNPPSRERINNYRLKRKTIDVSFVLVSNLRTRILKALDRNSKSDSTLELLGCSVDDLKSHLQKTAISNGYLEFNIDNYDRSKFHIDHIIPCSAFNLKCSFHQKLCFHYTNLQILTAKENLSKSDKLLI